MSSDEKLETRDESGSNDVEAHKFVSEAPGDDGPEGKRTQYEEPADPEGDEFGKRTK